MPGESKTSKRRLKARERWLSALELRKQGLTFEAIAKELGYKGGAPAAYKAVMTALKETLREPAKELRDLEAARLDTIQQKLSDNVGPDKEELPVIDRLLRIMERRAKLLGLDAARDTELPVIAGPLVIIRGPATKEEAENEKQK